MSNFYHVQLSKGSGFGVTTDKIWDLDFDTLSKRVLAPRAAGSPIWLAGNEVKWAEVRLRIFLGPSTSSVDNFSSLLTPELLCLAKDSGFVEVTDQYVLGPPGEVSGNSSGALDEATKRFQVFISSTFTDLRVEREVATAGLLRSGQFIPAGMELFGASGLPPWDVITRVLDLTDYVVLIIGHRYGSIDESTGLSFTEREYNYASDSGIPVLPFLTDAQRPVPPSAVEPPGPSADALAAFGARLERERTVTFWSNANSLANAIVSSVFGAVAATPRPGWYRPKVADV